MFATIESKLDVMKLQYAVIKAQWDEITADEHAAEADMDIIGERLLEAEEALRDEVLDLAGEQVGRDSEEFKLLKNIAHTDKFFDVIMK